MTKRNGWLLALAAAALVPAFSAKSPAQAEKVAEVEGITEYRLDNGLHVLLFPDKSRPKVTVNITYFVGSRHEGYGEAGMAHLLEHMVFKGTPTHPNIPGAMKERGANFNGTTWVDRTNYYEVLSATDENLEFALKLEADRMINSPIRPEDLASEFSVVRNEFESGENDPASILSQRMTAVAYEWHNYGKSTIGNRADIERVPVDSLRAFYKKYYQPDNALLIVAGNFDEAKALSLIEQYFGAIPKPDRELPKTYTEEPAQDGERSVTLRRVGDVGLVGLMYHVPAASHPEFPAIQVLTDVLTDAPSGRLYKALVETNKAADVGAFAAPFHDPGLIEITAEVNTKEKGPLETALEAMLATVEQVAEQGVTQEEVDRSRTQILNGRVRAAADPNSLAISLSNWAAQGDWRLYFLFRDRLEQVTPDQVKEVAAKYLTASNRTVGYFIPSEKPERTEIPPTPDVASLVEGYKGRDASTGGELLSTDPLVIEERVQRPDPIAGIKIALLPKETRGELVNLNLRLDYGDESNLKGLTEAAGFLSAMMQRGTRNLSRQELQDALDENFVQLGGGGPGGMMGGAAGVGSLSFSLQTKRENLPAALDLLRQILREPSFPANEFDTLKAQRLTMLGQMRSEPAMQAMNRLMQLASPYPADDVRYVPGVDERVERVEGVTLDQVKKVYDEYLGAGHGELAIVGDFEPSEVLPLLKPLFEGWEAKQAYARIERPVPPGLEGVRETILTPDKANAVYFGALLLPMDDADPDYAAIALGNHVLGGGAISSRIADRLRQKEGLSYGAGTSFNAQTLDERAQLTINAIYNPTNLEKVVAGVDEEFARFLTDGITSDELEKARAGYLEQRRVARSSDGGLAGSLVNQLYTGRTFAYDAQLEGQIEELTPEGVNAVVRERLDPKKLMVITAGDFPVDGPK